MDFNWSHFFNLFTTLLVLTLDTVSCTHFRGAVITWEPADDGVSVSTYILRFSSKIRLSSTNIIFIEWQTKKNFVSQQHVNK